MMIPIQVSDFFGKTTTRYRSHQITKGPLAATTKAGKVEKSAGAWLLKDGGKKWKIITIFSSENDPPVFEC